MQSLPSSPRSPSKKKQQPENPWNSNRVPASIRTTPSSAASQCGSKLSFTKPSTRKHLTESEEAELLSQATSQAMTAARSILMAGGSEATALSTAKAAATSILAPTATEYEHGRSFLGRRKGKRQAEIVASMALLSVKQTLYQSGSMKSPSQQGGVLPPSAQPSPLSMASRTASNLLSSPRPPRSARLASPARRTPFQPPAAGRLEATGKTMKEQWLSSMRRTPTPVPDQNSGSQTSTVATSSSSSPILPPTKCTPGPKVGSDGLTKLPDELPKPRQKTRDIAGELPNEDPIYYTDASTVPRRRNLSPTSYSTSSSCDTDSSGSNTMTCETYEEDTVEASAIANAIAQRNRILHESGAEAFLTNLSSLILCGMGGPEFKGIEADFGQSRDAPMNVRSNSINSRESLQSSDSEEDEDDNDSCSSVSSAELLQELNKTSFENTSNTQNPLIHASAMTDSIRKTVEQALELASSREKSVRTVSSAAKPVIEQRQEETEPHSTISLKFQPGTDDLSSLSMGKQNRLQVLSQRVKFRNWMKRRRAGDGSSSGKLPMYE